MKLRIVFVDGRRSAEGNAKLSLEEVGLDNYDDQGNTNKAKILSDKCSETRKHHSRRSCQIKTISDGVCENLCKIPTIGSHGRKDTINREGHDGAVIEKGDD